MLPQTELDNYKLQVELLQEKLKRSEEHRQQLEEKFENLMKKRNEEERKLRNKKKFKYQQFIEELKERNERNKELVRMLERVDQEAAVLAAKSERLKMMKIQYELYFAKLLEAQAQRSVQMAPKFYALLPTQPQTLPPQSTISSSSVIYPTSIENLYQTNDSIVGGKNSTPSIMENCNVMMANSLSNANIDKSLSYQIPSSLIHLSGQIPLNQVQLASSRQPPIRQVNLNSSNTEEDSIYSSHSKHSNIEMNNTTTMDDDGGNERARNNFKFYLNPNHSSSSVNSINIQKIFENEYESNKQMNDTQNIGRKNQENHEKRNEDNHFEQDKRTDGKPISQHLTSVQRENLTWNVNEDDRDNEYRLRNDFEKSQPINITKKTFKNDTEIDEPRQKINENTKEKMNLIRHENIPENEIKISTPENWMMLKDGNKLTEILKKTSPSMWDGDFERENNVNKSFFDLPPIKFGKKEKISIESIENVIYGEKISPISTENTDSIVPSTDKFLLHDNENFERKNKFDSHHQEEIGETRTKEIIAKNENERNTIIAADNLSTVPFKGIKEVESSEEKEVAENNQDRELIYDSKGSVNQQHPEKVNENYQNQPVHGDDEIQQRDSLLDENQKSREHQLIKDEQNTAVEQGDGLKTNEEKIVQGENQYTDSQYSNQDYQYQNETDYQNQAYSENYQGQDQNYQDDAYQYDPNAYQYNYDQQQDGQYADQYPSDYNSAGQYGVDGQYSADGQYLADGQYPAEEQYSTEGQYPTEQQYSAEGQYPTEGQYLADGQFNVDSTYQNPVQQNYSETVPGDQNYDDLKNQKDYEESTDTEYSQYAKKVPGYLENNEPYSEQQNSENIEQSSSSETHEPSKTFENRTEQQIASQRTPENPNDSAEKTDSQPIAKGAPVKPTSILATEKPGDQQISVKKKKRVNFLDSESEDSSSFQKADSASKKSDESDFDFSSK